MPSLTRRSRILIALASVVVILLLFGPRLIDTYVDWLWFGELGYRSVFTTVLFTRLVVFLVVTVLVAAVVFAGLALAYRSRPVFVPTSGPEDPVARYRTSVMARLKLFGIGIPLAVGVLAGLVAQSYWVRIQMFLHGGEFGVTDPEFGLDLGFYAFQLPFYRLVLTYLFVAVILALVANLVTHYIFGGIRLAGREGAVTRPARIQLVLLVGVVVLLKVAAYWLDRYELLSHTRAGKPFTGAGYTDINAVLPGKLILLAIAVICAVAVFSALVLRDLRIPAISLVLLLLSSLIVGAGWPLVVEQFSVKPNAAQKESEYISRSIAATRQAYGITEDTVTYRDYSGDAATSAQQVASDDATTSNIRVLDPRIVSPAFTQFQQAKNFYAFPEELSLDRYQTPDGMRQFVVAARELDPARLIDNQRDWINRHSVYTHGNGFIASPANTVRGIANDPNQNGGYPEFLASVVGANGSVTSPGPAPLEQPRIYYGPIIASAPADYAIVGANGEDREYDYENNTETRNYTYTGSGGVPVGNWLARSLFAAKYAERNFLFSNVIGPESKILFNRDPAKRVEAVAPWLTTDSVMYPAIVEGRIVWIVDGYTTLDNYPYSQLTTLSSATADSTAPSINNRLVPDKQVSYIRNSVKATVDAYDGTVTLYEHDENDPVLKAWMSVFPDTVKPKSDISDALKQHLRYPEDLFKVQRSLLARYHVDDPVTFFSTSDFWNVPQDPIRQGTFQPPYYVVANSLSRTDDGPSYQLTSPMNQLNREYLAAFISADSDPEHYGQLTVLTIPGQVRGPSLAHGAINTDTSVSEHLGQIGRDGQNRIQWGNMLTLPVGEGGLLYVQPVYASPGRADAASTYPRLIRVAMMYNDKVGYAPTVREALDQVFGRGAGATAVGPAPMAGQTPPAPEAAPADQPAANAAPRPETGPTTPAPAAAVPGTGGPVELSGAKAAALEELKSAMQSVKQAQQNGNFAEYGEALQKLDDAMNKYDAAN